MALRPPRAKRTDTLFPYTTLFRTFPRVLTGANPGGVGHNWVKASWIDPVAPMQTMRAEKSDGGMLRQFIPARLEDNPTLTANDPDYVDRLSGLGSVDRSEEHTSELQALMRMSYAFLGLKKK